MAVPYTFANATVSIPLSQLDSNFATAITLGNTAIQLGNTVTTLNNMTLANVTVSSGNATFTTANVTNMSSSNVTITGGTIANVTISGSGSNITATNINASNVTVSTDLTLSGGTANGVAYLNGSKVLTTGNALQFDGTNLGIGIFPTTSLDVAGPIRSRVIGGIGQLYLNNGTTQLSIDNNGGQMVFTTAGAAEQMRLTSTGLGIGTSSPASKLDVTGTGPNIIYSRNTGTTAADSAQIQCVSGAVYTQMYAYSYDGVGVVGTSSNHPFVFRTNGAERMRIDSSGNLFLQNVSNNVVIGNSASGVMYLGGGSTNTTAVIIQTGSSEKMRIDSSGNVGIGTSSPDSGGGAARWLTLNSSSSYTGGVIYQVGGVRQFLHYQDNDNLFTHQGAGSNVGQKFIVGGSERMRIDSSGNLLVGGTTASGKFVVTGAVGDAFIPSDGNGITFTRNAANYVYANGGSTATVVVISNTNGVVLNNGATSWSAFSDERTKDIIEPIENAAEKVSTLRAVIGKYKTDEEGKRRSFLIAQDVQAVLPEAVAPITQEDGSEVLGLSYTDTIPLLVAAIQELKAELDATKAEVAALKGK